MSDFKYTPIETKPFQKDRKRMLKQGRSIALLEAVIRALANGETLPARYKDHKLLGEYVGELF